MKIRLSELVAEPFQALHQSIRRGDAREYWLRGGRGSGKSSFVSLEIVLGILTHPGANAVIFRKVAATNRESVFEQVIWATEKLGVKSLFRFRVSPMEAAYRPTGQRILFRGADDPGKSKSIKAANGFFRYLWFEEATEFSGAEDIRSIQASVIRGGSGAVTFLTYNPPRSMKNWVNAEATVPKKGKIVHESNYTMLPRAWLGEDFCAEADAVRGSNERAWRHVYMGEITGDGGQVFDNVELREISDEEISRMSRFSNGMDFGFAVDPDAFVRIAYDSARRVAKIVAEYCAPRTPIDEAARRVREMAGDEVVRCDSADPRMIAEIRSRGVRAVPARKGPGSVAHGIRWLQERAKIVIDPARCPAAAREFSTYEYERDGRGEAVPAFPDRNNHTIDAARYALEPVILAREAHTVDRVRMGI